MSANARSSQLAIYILNDVMRQSHKPESSVHCDLVLFLLLF